MVYTNLVKFSEQGYPTCEEHGALLQVNKDGTLYRCPMCHVGIDIRNIFTFVERQILIVQQYIVEEEIKRLTGSER